MKITIYELLGLLKDGKAPKKIKVDSYILDLVENETNWKLAYIDGYNDYLFVDYHITLNDEILVLEEVEDKEYEDIEEIKILTDDTNMNYVANDEYGKLSYANSDLLFANRINVLIRNQKKILERLDK